MSDWKTLPAGRALDYEIAEMLGYTDIEETEVFIEDMGYAGWERRWRGKKLSGDDWCYIPAYSTSVDAALMLVSQVPGTFVLQSSADSIWQAWFGTPSVPQAVADTPALAICRAWLTYKEGMSK